MGLLDRLLGREDQSRGRPAWNTQPRPPQRERTDDEVAIERYRYMLRTAPPEQVEEAHAEAFAKLTPQQRQQVLDELSATVPVSERAQSDDPRSLARMATRAEMRQPGTMERALGGGRGMGMGGMIAGGLLASVAGAFIGTAIADAMFDFNDSGESSQAADGGGDGGDGGGDAGGGGGDYGGDYGSGGGFDGGDFGGDFGGGDFGGF
jgi:acyl transferase domain-containing protein